MNSKIILIGRDRPVTYALMRRLSTKLKERQRILRDARIAAHSILPYLRSPVSSLRSQAHL